MAIYLSLCYNNVVAKKQKNRKIPRSFTTNASAFNAGQSNGKVDIKMEIKISDVIRNKRREMNISQEALGEIFGVTVQAVSKWETGISYPDITMLPKIAEQFNISLDRLFYGIGGDYRESLVLDELPNDNILRMIQFRGREVLKKEVYRKGETFELLIPENSEKTISFEIWGNADIQGDVSGSVHAGDGVNCGGVGGDVHAGDGVNCGGVGGDVHCGDGVHCGGVGGSVHCGDGINCGGVEGSVEAGGDIRCGNISGNVRASGNIECDVIGGDVQCDGDVIIKKQK